MLSRKTKNGFSSFFFLFFLLPFFLFSSTKEKNPASAPPLAHQNHHVFSYTAQFYSLTSPEFQTASPRSLDRSATTRPLAAETEHASDRAPKVSAIDPCSALLPLLLRAAGDLEKKAKAGGSTNVAGAKARAPTRAMQTEKNGRAAAAAATRST